MILPFLRNAWDEAMIKRCRSNLGTIEPMPLSPVLLSTDGTAKPARRVCSQHLAGSAR